MPRIRSEDFAPSQDKIEYPVGGDANAKPVDYTSGVIETDTFTMDEMALEKLLNEKCIVTVQRPSNDKRVGLLLSVNSETQPVVFNRPTTMKLKFIESLINARSTEYEQEESKSWDVTDSKVVGQRSHSYPFSLNDCSPQARKWYLSRMGLPG